MVELDRDVSAFWQAALHHTYEMVRLIDGFIPTHETVHILEERLPVDVTGRGFRTLVLNRTRRGGILVRGAALTRAGENGRGVLSRWYPETIKLRLSAIAAHADRIDFHEGDGVQVLGEVIAAGLASSVAVFVDPPYTAAGKQAGRRLYTHNSVDHVHLFDVLAGIAGGGGEFLATYDESPEILSLVARHGFHAVRVMMKNTHHDRVAELVITNRELFRA